MFTQLECVGAALEIVEQHVLGREVQRPVVALRERVAVVVVRVVDPASGIRVLEPRPADVVVLLDDDEGDTGLLQAVRGEQPRHPGTDDQRRGSRRPGAISSMRQPGARRSSPRYASSSSSSGRYGCISAPPTAYCMISSSCSSEGGGAGRQPASRNRTSASNATRARLRLLLVAQSALRQRRPSSGSGRSSGRRSDRSPVAYASRREQRRDSASARKARISSSDSVIGSIAATNGLEVNVSVKICRPAHASTPFGACCFMKPNR